MAELDDLEAENRELRAAIVEAGKQNDALGYARGLENAARVADVFWDGDSSATWIKCCKHLAAAIRALLPSRATEPPAPAAPSGHDAALRASFDAVYERDAARSPAAPAVPRTVAGDISYVTSSPVALRANFEAVLAERDEARAACERLRARLAKLERAAAHAIADYEATDEVNSNTVGELMEAIK